MELSESREDDPPSLHKDGGTRLYSAIFLSQNELDGELNSAEEKEYQLL